jgi:isoamylase
MKRLFCSLTLAALLSACPDDDSGAERYADRPIAPSMTEEGVAALDHMGPVITDDGVNFAVYSERATRLDLLLFDDPESDRPAKTFTLTRFGDVWSVFVEGVGVGQHYGYRAFGPNWPEHDDWFSGSIHGFISDVDSDGNRFNPNKLLLDPYAKAIHRDHDWSRASAASGPARTESTTGAGSKSVVVANTYVWSAAEAEWRAQRAAKTLPGHAEHELILYEVHLKGFTADPASGVAHPGTYRGVAEKAEYLADLGINAVEFLPVHEKPLDGGYWGYWTTSFFAPELTYASIPAPHAVLDEFRAMVEALHAAGIEVILDVVYNHTGEGGLWRERVFLDDHDLDPGTQSAMVNLDPEETASIFSFRGLDNAAYYALNEGNRTYWNNTGVGNQTRANHRPMRRLILDSLRFYVEELHVDGFRFDLAGILGEVDGDYNNWDDPANTVLQEIIDDPVLTAAGTRIIAEPWTAGGNYGPLIGAYPAASDASGRGWMEWSARFRDTWRAFVNDDGWRLNSREADADLGTVLTASEATYHANGRHPLTAVNYITSHDGFTLFDLVSFAGRRNGCSPLNPVCCDAPASPWCEQDSGDQHNRSRAWEDEGIKRQMMRNFFTAMMIAHGTPMLLGGDEWMRTQLGNNNAYSSGADNPYNHFRWGTWLADPVRQRMHDFVRQMIAFRKANAHAFAPPTYGGGAPFAWKSPANTDAVDWSGKALMIHYWDPDAGPELAILINMDRGPRTFSLPGARTWRRVVDTQAWWDSDEFLADRDPSISHNLAYEAGEAMPESYELVGSSVVIMRADAP